MGLGQTKKYASLLITLAFILSFLLHLTSLFFLNQLALEEEFKTGRAAFNVSLSQKSIESAHKAVSKVVKKQVLEVPLEKLEPKTIFSNKNLKVEVPVPDKVLKKRDVLSQSQTIKELKASKAEVLETIKQAKTKIKKAKEESTSDVVDEVTPQKTKEELESKQTESVVQTPQYSLGSAETPRPNYPIIAQRRNWQGQVVLGVKVGVDGRSTSIKVLSSSGYAVLDNSAIETVREQWVFTPGQVARQSVSAYVTVPISFHFQ